MKEDFNPQIHNLGVEGRMYNMIKIMYYSTYNQKDDLWTVIENNAPTSTDRTALQSWTKKDSKARAVIGLAVEDSQVNLVKNATSATQAWSALKEYHEKAILATEVMILKQLCQLKYTEDKNMEHHLNEMDNLIERLTSLSQTVPERMKFALMLCSLPDSYNPLIIALEVRPIENLTYSIVKNAVGDYKRRESQLKSEENGEVALKVNKGNKGEIVCYFCHRIRHIKPNCPRYKKWKSKVNKMRAIAV